MIALGRALIAVAHPNWPRAGEISLKAWTLGEAERTGARWETVCRRFQRGKYAGLRVRRANKRVVFVKVG